MSGLGKMKATIKRVSGQQYYALTCDRGLKPKVRMVNRGLIFHDLHRTGVRNLVRGGVLVRFKQPISGHKACSGFERHSIVSPSDFQEAGRKLAKFYNQKFGSISGTAVSEKPTSFTQDN
jgi:hypothetical protein